MPKGTVTIDDQPRGDGERGGGEVGRADDGAGCLWVGGRKELVFVSGS